MTKKAGILILLSSVLLILVFYIFLTSESVSKNNNLNKPAEVRVAVLSEGDYKAKIKDIFNVYEKMFQDNTFTIEKIADLRNKLLGLKGLPPEFKDLHIKLVLALDRLEDYLKQNDQQKKNASWQMASQLRADYGWLSN